MLYFGITLASVHYAVLCLYTCMWLCTLVMFCLPVCHLYSVQEGYAGQGSPEKASNHGSIILDMWGVPNIRGIKAHFKKIQVLVASLACEEGDERERERDSRLIRFSIIFESLLGW